MKIKFDDLDAVSALKTRIAALEHRAAALSAEIDNLIRTTTEEMFIDAVQGGSEGIKQVVMGARATVQAKRRESAALINAINTLRNRVRLIDRSDNDSLALLQRVRDEMEEVFREQ